MSSLAGKSMKVHPLWKYLGVILVVVATGFLAAKKGPMILGAWVALPIAGLALIMLFRYPQLNLYAVLFLGFFLAFLGRYVPVNVPWSIGIDVFLVLALLIPVIKYWKKTDFSLANRSIVALLGIWMFYIFLELFNPEAKSEMAWLFVMRAIALYPLLIVTCTLILLNTKKDFYRFLNIWLALSFLGIIWALKQHYLGVSTAERQWLEAGAKSTHILFGKLRVFAYYFDAANFGAAMGQSCIVALILYLGPFSKRRKMIYLVVGLLSFYALMLSGTRGALAVPAIGGMAYLIMIRRIKLLMLGAAVLLSGFIFLKHTNIGQSNYAIGRLRSALDPEDVSLNVRLRNRAALSEYLHDKPFGGGLGTAGYWGRRFSPNTWLANFSTDGLYTQIRAETGIVGRNLYVGILLIILFRGMVIAGRMKNPEHKILAIAILSGYAGILMANYGNSVMTQFPVSILTYMGLAFVFSMKYWNEEGEVELPGKPTPEAGKSPATSHIGGEK